MSDARLLIVLQRNYEGIRKNWALCSMLEVVEFWQRTYV